MRTYLAKKKIKEFITMEFGIGHSLKEKQIGYHDKMKGGKHHYLVVENDCDSDFIKAEYIAKNLTHLYELMTEKGE